MGGPHQPDQGARTRRRPSKLEAALAPILDVDGALRFLALDNALINNDGYWTRASDYSLYQDVNGNFHVIPHDFNETVNETEGRGFGGGGRRSASTSTRSSAWTMTRKPLRSKLLAVPALARALSSATSAISPSGGSIGRSSGRSRMRYQALIAADVKSDTHKLYGFDEL